MARIAARDARTVFGSNVKLLSEVSGLDPWETGRVVMKRAINIRETRNVPAEDSWRIPYLHRLFERQHMAYYNDEESKYDETTSLINSLTQN